MQSSSCIGGLRTRGRAKGLEASGTSSRSPEPAIVNVSEEYHCTSHERSDSLASAAVRLHHHLPLPVPAADDGPRAAHRGAEGRRAAGPGDERWDEAARFWIRIFGLNFAVGVVTGHPDGVPVRHELGALLALRRAASSGRRSRWKGMFAFFLESSFLGAAPVRREAGSVRAATWPRRCCALGRHLALRLLHHRDQRLHAAPGRARARRRRRCCSLESLGRSS